MMTRVNGQDIKMTFVDHPHTAPQYQRDLSRLASQTGVGNGGISGLGNAYYSEKHGQVVVDVASNVKGALGCGRSCELSPAQLTAPVENERQ
jgi:hypothetical protein